ncbi:Dehydrogenase/reductase SDR family member 11 [Araneus ventricosus]|uniref:Dehydrogenase/reductase SDR family member 11 n=1 Tax=Araneus ventricosus TaxID=182803 RepID=A0A4Y2NEY1_ARAVE|nr:Dehydrogenase/reductase SDR family member 11 [Araneus ventricosus]
MYNMDRWQGRVAVVTGASAGIGAELFRALVRHGMKVVGCARSMDKIKAIAEEDAMKASHGKLVGVGRNLANESDILSMFDEIRRTFDRLDVCINNAGLGYECSLLTGCTSYFRNMLDLKEFLGGKRFVSDEELENAVTTWLVELAAEEYDMGNLKLVDRYDKCLNVGGDYVEN